MAFAPKENYMELSNVRDHSLYYQGLKMNDPNLNYATLQPSPNEHHYTDLNQPVKSVRGPPNHYQINPKHGMSEIPPIYTGYPNQNSPYSQYEQIKEGHPKDVQYYNQGPRPFTSNGNGPYYSHEPPPSYESSNMAADAVYYSDSAPIDYENCTKQKPKDGVYYSQPPLDDKIMSQQGHIDQHESVKIDNRTNTYVDNSRRYKNKQKDSQRNKTNNSQKYVYDNKKDGGTVTENYYNTIRSSVFNQEYDEIPYDAVAKTPPQSRTQSQSSLRSTSSVEPILPSDKEGTICACSRKRKIIIVVCVVVLLVLLIAVIGGVIASQGQKAEQTSSLFATNYSTTEQNKPVTSTTSITSGKTSSTIPTLSWTWSTTTSITPTVPRTWSTTTTPTVSRAWSTTTPTVPRTWSTTTPTVPRTWSTTTPTTPTVPMTWSTTTPTTPIVSRTWSTTTPTTPTVPRTWPTTTPTVSTPTKMPKTSITTTFSTASTTSTTTISSASATISTQIRQKDTTLVMIDHPVSKSRLVGDSVTLCCSTAGSPPPQYFDWLKDGQLLPAHTQMTNETSMIKLTNLQLSDKGYYMCRATNIFGKVTSDAAYLDVRGTNNFCATTPQEWNMNLPDGCTSSGSNTLSIGRCPNTPCRGSEPDPTSCIDSSAQFYCCGPVSSNKVTMTCGSKTFNVYTVKECGCVHCMDPYYNIIGVAQSVDGSSRYQNGHTYIESITSQYNDRLSDIGIFQLKIQQSTRRLVAITYNVYDRPYYNLSHHVIHLPPESYGPMYSTPDVRFIKRTTTEHQSSNAVSKMVYFDDGQTLFVQLNIPGDNYYDSSGKLYNGAIQVSANAISSTNIPSLRAAPGDFTYVGSDGKQHFLFVQGILAIQFDRKTDYLSYIGSLDITFASYVLGDPSAAQLWRLGSSGYWHLEDRIQSAGKRKKRTTFNILKTSIKDIITGHAWFAIAHPTNVKVCVTKVRIFENDVGVAGAQLKGAQVMIYARNTYKSAGVYTTRAQTDHGDDNGYCIMHPCGSGITGEVFVSYEGKALMTTSNNANNVPVSLNEPTTGSSGPTYTISEALRCSEASISGHTYVSLKRSTCEKRFDAVQPPKSFVGLSCKAENYLTWHTALEYSAESFKSCHMKIYNPGGSGNTFRAISYVGTLSHQVGGNSVSPRQLYGFRDDCVTNIAHVTCLEIKIGGSRNCNNDNANQKSDTQTKVSVFSLNKPNITVTAVDNTLVRGSTIESQNAVFTLKFTDQPYGTNYGIYCANDDSPESAIWRSKRRCLKGSSSDYYDGGVTDITNDYWAVTFN